MRGHDELGGEPQVGGQLLGEAAGIFAGVVRGHALVGKQVGVAPHGLAVGAPEDVERPARQLLAGVPLALAEVQEAALAVLVAQLVGQAGGVGALRGAQGIGVPFGGIAVAHRHKGGLAAHGQAHVTGGQLFIDGFAQGQDVGPLLVGVGLGDAGGFVQPGDHHVVGKFDLGFIHAAFDGRGAGRLGRASQRDVAFASEQARGGIQADPACAGQEHFAPGVQVGEVHRGAAGAVQGLYVGGELDQVARHKARRQAAVAQQLHQQPAGVAAGAAGLLKCFFGRLHAGLHADQVLDVALDLLVDGDQEVVGGLLLQVQLVQVGLHQRGGGLGDQVGRELFLQRGAVLEREVLGLGLQEIVEGVVHRHFDDQIDRDLELGGFGGEHQAGLVVGKRVLLPVDEVLSGFYLERVRDDVAAAVGCWAQANHLGAEVDRAVVLVVRNVVQCGMDGHVSVSWRLQNRVRSCESPGGCGNAVTYPHTSKS